MASMLDQFNSSSTSRQMDTMSNKIPSHSGFVSLNLDTSEGKMFSKHKMNIVLPHKIEHLAVNNGQLVLVMANNVVFRMLLTDVDKYDEIPLDQYLVGLKIANIFLDPTGAHLLVSLTPKGTQITPELLYLQKNQKRPKRIDKFKDHEVTAIAFNYENTSELTTGQILLGTSKGLVFESEFAIEADKPVQNNWRQVFDIGRSDRLPVNGLEFFRVPATNTYIVMATSHDRLYKFHETVRPEERSPFQSVFSAYLNVPEQLREFQAIETPSQVATAKLRVCYDYRVQFPRAFGWLSGDGIFVGEMDTNSVSHAHVQTHSNIDFPAGSQTAPLAFTLTDFHIILVYADHISAVSVLSHETVYEEYFSEKFGPLQNVVRDQKQGVVYVFSSKYIFRLRVTNESRNVWRIHLNNNEYELALRYAGDNLLHRDIVRTRQADNLFAAGSHLEAAKIYAESKANFEGICLKFLNADANDALRLFLLERLRGLPTKDSSQITMLVVWLVEIFLTQLSKAAAADSAATSAKQLQTEFEAFLRMDRVVHCMKEHRAAVYDLLASHGDKENLAKLTAFNSDFEAVLNQYLNQGQYQDALKVLKGQRRPDLFYKYCPILMEDIPRETVTALMEQKGTLNPVHLLPTLICGPDASTTHRNEVVRYLEFCVHSLGCTEQAIHNFLIRLFADDRKTEKLKTYFETQGQDVTMIHYDRYYALRVCQERGCLQACVFLQCLMDMHVQAVDLALTFDVALAQETASQPHDVELRRKLWLRIAKHEIEGRDSVESALALLKKCDLLRIEDILMYFSDFEEIDPFKAAICDALKEYNLRIQEQKNDMEEAAQSADRVRADLQNFRNRSVTIAATDLCSLCTNYLLVRACFIFPCGHKFHNDCLEKAIKERNRDEYQKLFVLKQRMNPDQPDFVQVRTEYEDMLASECMQCGEAMIGAIDQPFVEDWE